MLWNKYIYSYFISIISSAKYISSQGLVIWDVSTRINSYLTKEIYISTWPLISGISIFRWYISVPSILWVVVTIFLVGLPGY